MTILLAFLVLAGGGLFFANAFKKSFAVSMPFFVLASILVLYVSGLFTTLLPGFFALVAVGVAGLLWVAWRIIKKQTRKDALKQIFSPGFLAYAAIFVLIMLINKSRVFVHWDDFSHWGPVIKETLRMNDFYNSTGTALNIHRDYPPAIVLFEYLFCKIRGAFSEANVFRALQLMSMSLMLPVFDRASKKHVFRNVLLAAAMLVLPGALGLGLYDSVYIDAILGIIFGYGLYVVISNTKPSLFYYTNLFLVCFVLGIAKQIGPFLSALLLLVVAIKMLVRSKDLFKRFKQNLGEWKHYLITLAVGGAAILFAYLSWKSFLKIVDVPAGQFDIGKVSISGFIDALRGVGPDNQVAALRAFVDTFFTGALVKFFSMPYFALTVVGTLITALFYKMSKAKKMKKNKEILAFSIAVPVIAVAYAFLMLLLYMFAFDAYEGPRLASYQRYMATLWLGVFVALFLTLSSMSAKHESKQPQEGLMLKPVSLFLVCAVLFGAMVPAETYLSMFPKNALVRHYPEAIFKQANPELFDKVNFEKDRTYFVFQGTQGFEFWQAKYYANPIRTNSVFTWALDTEVAKEDLWTRKVEPQTWASELWAENYTYVYVVKTNDALKQKYGLLFSEVPEDHMLFRVVNVNGEIKLVLA